MESEPAIERGDVLAMMGAIADLNVNVARILRLLEDALGGNDGEEEEEV